MTRSVTSIPEVTVTERPAQFELAPAMILPLLSKDQTNVLGTIQSAGLTI